MTTAGVPSWSEVADLVRAKDATIQAVRVAAQAIATDWLAKDAAAAGIWFTQWALLEERYSAAKAKYPQGGYFQAGWAWHEILHALKQNWQTWSENPAASFTQAPSVVPGDLADLAARLTQAGGKPDFSHVPQPVANDQDLAWYKAADVIVRLVKPTLEGAGAIVLLVVALWALKK